MSNKLKRSKEALAHYAKYQNLNSCAKNKQRKLEKHCLKHKNDLQAQNALKKGVGRTRKTPNEQLGWVSESIKNALGSTPPTRTAARQMAQVLAHSRKIARTSRTKEEQVLWRKIVEAQTKADVKAAEQKAKNEANVPAKPKK